MREKMACLRDKPRKNWKQNKFRKIERCERNGFTPLSAKLKKIKRKKIKREKIKRKK